MREVLPELPEALLEQRRRTGLDRYDEMRAVLTETFRSRTQAEWIEVFEGTDACVAGIVPISEAVEHPHLAARGTFVVKDDMPQPAPAPRFSRTPTRPVSTPTHASDRIDELLERWDPVPLTADVQP